MYYCWQCEQLSKGWTTMWWNHCSNLLNDIINIQISVCVLVISESNCSVEMLDVTSIVVVMKLNSCTIQVVYVSYHTGNITQCHEVNGLFLKLVVLVNLTLMCLAVRSHVFLTPSNSFSFSCKGFSTALSCSYNEQIHYTLWLSILIFCCCGYSFSNITDTEGKVYPLHSYK